MKVTTCHLGDLRLLSNVEFITSDLGAVRVQRAPLIRVEVVFTLDGDIL